MAINRQQQCLEFFYVVIEFINSIWDDRNNLFFRSNRKIAPVSLIWYWVVSQLEALEICIDNPRVRNRIRQNRELFQAFVNGV